MNKKNIQNITDKCLSLMEKGYSLSYCLEKYSYCRDRLEPYLKTAMQIKGLKSLQPDENFKKSTLQHVLSQIPQKRPRARWLKPAIAFIAAFMIVSFSFAGTAYAAQSSIPGQALYPVKRTVEEVQLFIYPPAQKAKLHLNMLNRRIEEARQVMASEDTPQQLADQVMQNIEQQYGQCKQYGYLSSENQDQIIEDIESINGRYQKRYGHKNQNRHNQ
ncbi:MAG: DUF5667 domain-containing protein [Actinomycetota bacterium]|nr:DUF5667 domain-containing protein [Actinomycetota bacterium]